MKLKLIPRTLILLIVPWSWSIVGCRDGDKAILEYPSVFIEETDDIGSSHFYVTFKPDDKTSRFIYAIGNESDFKAFADASMPGIRQQSGKETLTVKFDGLQQGQVYTVFTRGYDANEEAGDVSSIKIRTEVSKFSVNVGFVADKSAAFAIVQSGYYCKLRYALDAPGKADSFDKNFVKSTTVEHPSELTEYAGGYTATYFELEPDTEYSFYAVGYDRFGGVSEVIETPIRTHTEGSCPSANFEILDIDIYKGKYKLAANEHCEKFAVWIERRAVSDPGTADEWGARGDPFSMLASWVNAEDNMVTISRDGGMIEIETVTPGLFNDDELVAYVITYDKNKKPFGIQKFGEIKTPAFDRGAGRAEVSTEVSEITASGAKYSFTPNEHTVLYLYETVEADWWDELTNTEQEKYDGLLQILLYNYPLNHYLVAYEGHWFHKNDSPQTWTEDSPETKAGKRYYIAVFAMNSNGEWGKLSMKEFTTLEN